MTTLIGGRYEIIEKLGEGGFGITYTAHDRGLPDAPIVVVKKLIIQHNSKPEILKKTQEYFQREAKILKEIGGENGIPKFHNFIFEKNEFYLVQEYIEGMDLSTRLRTGELTEIKTIDILQDILTSLTIVHQYNIIHCDLKPDNIRIRNDDLKIFLIDFGIAKRIKSTIDPDTWKCGTPGYRPEEHLPVFSTDIYAVGKIGIQALTGISPLEPSFPIAPNGKIVSKNIKASPQLINWLNKAIAPDRNNRYVNADAALKALPTTAVSNPKRYISILLIFLAACSLLAILTNILIRRDPTYEENWKPYNNAGIQFEYPPQWQLSPISSVKDFQSSFTGDILEIAPTADKDESCERLLLNIKSAPRSNYTLDLYRQNTIARIKKINDGLKFHKMTTLNPKLAGKSAYRLIFERKDRRCKILQSIQTGITSQGKTYYLNYSFIPDDRNENRQRIFDRVVSSFKLKN